MPQGVSLASATFLHAVADRHQELASVAARRLRRAASRPALTHCEASAAAAMLRRRDAALGGGAEPRGLRATHRAGAGALDDLTLREWRRACRPQAGTAVA